jgi:tetratricopeptide (TPR) repeat protein
MIRVRKLIVLFILIVVSAIGALITDASEEPQTRMVLAEAEELFQQASNTEDKERARILFEKALLRFESALEDGQGGSGKLLYNIGNTYYRLGDFGRAILFYRRAQLLIPADPNLSHNLRYVRSLRVDLIPSWQHSALYRTLFFWHYSLPQWVRISLLIASFWGICLITALSLLKPDLRIRWKMIFITACGAIIIIMTASLVADEIKLRTLRDGVITAEEVIARKGDGTAYQRSFVDPLHQGTEFKLLEERAGWYYIELMDRRTGWIPDSAAEMVIPPEDGG